ncbi:MAG: glycosyltransferase family 2 protein, partial [Desulfatirhabdiaceae bacterium]
MILPVVSVIIPTFNRCEWVREAIDSVLAQTFQTVELIVVDDGSTDKTYDMLMTCGDSIKVIRQSNRGVSAARNQGIVQSTGQYIALLDSDDLWLPRKIEIQVDFFLTNPEALICQTDEIW